LFIRAADHQHLSIIQPIAVPSGSQQQRLISKHAQVHITRLTRKTNTKTEVEIPLNPLPVAVYSDFNISGMFFKKLLSDGKSIYICPD